jgi:hypothetical protein
LPPLKNWPLQIVPVLLEGGHGLREAVDGGGFELRAARLDQARATGMLGHDRGQDLRRRRGLLVRLVVEPPVGHRADHAQEDVLLRLASRLEEFTLVHG